MQPSATPLRDLTSIASAIVSLLFALASASFWYASAQVSVPAGEFASQAVTAAFQRQSSLNALGAWMLLGVVAFQLIHFVIEKRIDDMLRAILSRISRPRSR